MKIPADKLFITVSGLLVLLFAIATALSYQQSKDADETASLLNHTQEVLAQTASLKSAITEIQNNVRGYALTGLQEFVPTTNLSFTTIHEEIRNLQQLTADNETQQKNILSLQENTLWLTHFLDSLVFTRKEKGLEAVSALVGTLKGYIYIDHISQSLVAIQSEENRLLKLRKDRNERSISVLKGMIFSIALLGTALIIFLLRRIWRHTVARKITEEHLMESEERNRLLICNVKDYAIFMIDKDGYILSWNDGGQSIKGYTNEEIIGKHISIFYTERDRNLGEPAKNLAIAAQNKRLEKEGWRVKKDGSIFRANIVFTALYDTHGQLRGYSKITRDITQVKIDEEKIKYQAKLMEDVSDAVFSTDQNFIIKAWNKAAEKLYGYTAAEVIGQAVSQIIRPQIDEARRNKLREQLQVNGHLAGEIKHTKKDGSALILYISNSVSYTHLTLPTIYSV